jgi:thiamine pyrophosphate-dependent acetolactate synthase large subunit-like protein
MMHAAEVLKVFQEHRGDAIVIPGSAGRHWAPISTRPDRDLPLLPSSVMGAMGGRAAFALGLALAQPEVKVVVFDTEGDLLMGLGVLPTIAEEQPANFYHFLLDNECYATTGGQPVPNAKNVSYDVIARGAGYARTYAYDKLETFSVNVGRILSEPGPVLMALKVVAEIQNVAMGERKAWTTRSREEVLRDFRESFGGAKRAS